MTDLDPAFPKDGATFIYVAGPYTGDIPGNVRRAVEVGQMVRDMGFVPFVPHLFSLWDSMIPAGYEQWMALCMAWITRCDALLRIHGDSPGADREVAVATQLGIPVFHHIDHLELWAEERKAVPPEPHEASDSERLAYHVLSAKMDGLRLPRVEKEMDKLAARLLPKPSHVDGPREASP